jgi:tape measure domain-containing protein
MADSAERIYKLTVQADQALRELDKLNTATKKSQESLDEIGQASKQFNNISAAIGKAGAAIGAAFAAVQSLKAITNATDQLNQLKGSFEALLGSGERAVDMLSKVVDIAGRTGAPLEDVGKAAQRLSVALGEVGATNAEIAQITENFIKLGRVGGSSMADISGALLQFTQSLASGKLQGDELRSIFERVPGVIQLIAKEMNVTTGEVKALGSAGAITSDIMRKSLLSATEEVAAKFELLPQTFEQATNRLTTQWTLFLAAIDKATGISTGLATIFERITSILGDLTKELDNANGSFSALRSGFEAVGQVAEAIGTTLDKIVGLALRWVDVINTLYRILNSVFTLNWQGLQDAIGGLYSRTLDWAKALLTVRTEAEKTATALNVMNKAAEPSNNADVSDKLIYGLREAERVAAETANTIRVLNAAGFDEDGKLLKKTRERTKAHQEEKTAIEQVLTAFQQWDIEIAKAAGATDDAATKLIYFRRTLSELEASGQGGTNFATQLRKSIDELAAAADPLEAFRQSAIATQKETDLIASKIEILFEMLGSGQITGEVFDKLSAGFQKAGKSAKDAGDKTLTFMEQVGKDATSAGNQFVTGFVDQLIEGNDKVTESFGTLVASLLKTMAKLLVSTIFTNFIKALTQINASPGAAPAVASGRGNVFGAGGRLIPFASGGIIGGPTFFGMSGGRIGLAGEAGAEAIVPLTRHNGELGVKASPTTINVFNQASPDVSVETTTKDNADGSRQIDFYVKRTVKTMFDGGDMDKQMRQNYGLTRQAV